MTWPSRGEGLGWGGCFAEESDDLKWKFEVDYGGDEAQFHKHWLQGFRWTCCGTEGGMKRGCDHHGTGSRPCTCDYCRCICIFRSSFSVIWAEFNMMAALILSRMGKPLQDSIFKERSQTRHDLTLSHGPDRRSFHPSLSRTPTM